jgi:hypothetical protein
MSGKWSLEIFNFMLFAGIGWTDGISREQDWHKSIYTIEYIKEQLLSNNIKIINTHYDSYENAGNSNLNLYIQGIKKNEM